MKQRDIVLLPFDYSDFSWKKIRPAVVLSNDNFNASSDDLLVCGMTSNVKPSSYGIEISEKDLEEGILHHKSMIKAESLAKLEKSLVIKKIGTLNKKVFVEVIKAVADLIEPS